MLAFHARKKTCWACQSFRMHPRMDLWVPSCCDKVKTQVPKHSNSGSSNAAKAESIIATIDGPLMIFCFAPHGHARVCGQDGTAPLSHTAIQTWTVASSRWMGHVFLPLPHFTAPLIHHHHHQLHHHSLPNYEHLSHDDCSHHPLWENPFVKQPA